jgi:uncharacterized delta-60 repeat protein
MIASLRSATRSLTSGSGSLFFRACAVAAFAITTATNAAPGDFDNSFGAGLGKVLQPMGTGDDLGSGLALLPGGKFIVHGTCYSGPGGLDYDYCLARFNANGSLDTSFGTNGKVFANFSAIARKSTFFIAKRAAVQADGKIIVALSCLATGAPEYEICLARHHENGALDTSFGTNGHAVASLSGASLEITDLALENTGKSLVAFKCTPTQNPNRSYFCVARFTASGLLDEYEGVIAITTFTADATPTALAIDSTNRSILAGNCRNTTSSAWQYCIVRRLANGDEDASFGVNGEVRHSVGVGNDASVSSVIAQPDGRILLGGRCRSSTTLPGEFCILRLNQNGSVDNSIGANGLIFISGAVRGSSITSMTLLPNGQYLLGGICFPNSTNFQTDFCLMRIHDDGSRDTSFGTDGQVAVPVGTKSDNLGAVAYTHDGKILVAGACEGAVNGQHDFCLARFEGGPYAETRCSSDLDGDGRFTATIDGLIAQRVMNGVTGSAAIAGVNFPAGATRTSWSAIRHFLVSQCGLSLAL